MGSPALLRVTAPQRCTVRLHNGRQNGLQRHAVTPTSARPGGGGSGKGDAGSSEMQQKAVVTQGADTAPATAEAQPNVKSLEFPPPGGGTATAAHPSALRSSGLHQVPTGTGVQNATQRCDLPSPAVAVRNLVEQAQIAHLCTTMSSMHHRRAGYPFGTVVDFAADGAGHPIFSLSPLAIQFRNIQEDPRCSLVVQLPGYTGLANARVTIFGDVYQLPKHMQEQAREIFHAKQAGCVGSGSSSNERWVSGNAVYFRMNRILDIYFVGGFGTVQWVDSGEYTTVDPDPIILNSPCKTLSALNEAYATSMRDVLSQPGNAADDAAFISIDRLGTDIRVRKGSEYSVVRIGFDRPVDTLEEAKAAMQQLLRNPAGLRLST